MHVRNVSALTAIVIGSLTLSGCAAIEGIFKAGVWTGKPLHIALQAPKDPALRSAVLVQQGAGGPLLAAARL